MPQTVITVTNIVIGQFVQPVLRMTAQAIAELSQVEPDEGASLREEVYLRLSELLISGRLAPGDKVSLRDVAGALDVSIMPVREAASRLVADHALEITPSRAIRVPIMTRAEFIELTRIRKTIEGHAAAEAALHHTTEDLQRLRSAQSSFRTQSMASRPAARRVIGANMKFHFALYSAAGSPLLVKIIRGLWLKAGPVINLSVGQPPNRIAVDGVELHDIVLDAVLNHDGERARKGLVDDIDSGAERILRHGTFQDDPPVKDRGRSFGET